MSASKVPYWEVVVVSCLKGILFIFQYIYSDLHDRTPSGSDIERQLSR